MKECSKCRRCYDDSHIVCPIDDKPLVSSITCNVLISGRYLLEERLGKGGMGIVFKAKHKFLKSSHAIKLILPSLVEDDETLLVRFKQEAILAASIDHPNVIRVTDFGVEDETMPYLVMEFVDGSPLSSYLVKGERLTPERAFELFQPIALGVAEAHSRGITHRDLKPQNIMVVKGLPLKRAIKVLDFGLAKIKSTESFGSMIQAETMSNVIGSPPYMSPEQWENNKVDHRTDIYGLGVILYQMLTGNLPFQGDSVPSIMYQHLTVEMPQFASHGVSLSPQLEAVVARALQKDRENRPDTIEEMLAEFEEALKTVDVPLTVNIPAEQLKSFGQSSSPKNEKSILYPADAIKQPLSETQKEKLYSYFNSSPKLDLLANQQLAQKFLYAQKLAEEAEKQINSADETLQKLFESQKIPQKAQQDALEAKNLIETDVRQRIEIQVNNRLTVEQQNRKKIELQKIDQEINARKEAGERAESLANAALEASRNAEIEYGKAQNQVRETTTEENARRAESIFNQTAQQITDAKIRYKAANQQAEYEAELRKSAEDSWQKTENELQILVRQDEELRNMAETEVQKQIREQAEPLVKEISAARKQIEETQQLVELETQKRSQAEIDKARAEEEVRRLAKEIRSLQGTKAPNSFDQNTPSDFTSPSSRRSENFHDSAMSASSSNQPTLPVVQTALDASQRTVEIQARNSDENFKSFVNTDSIPKRKISLPAILAGVFGLLVIAAVGGYGVYKFVTPNPQIPEPNIANKPDDKPDNKPIEKVPNVKLQMISIKGGTFQMGRNDVPQQDLDWGNQYPAHPVTVKDFEVSKTEISNEEYAEFMKATGHAAPGSWNNGKLPEDQEKMPVTFVSLTDAKAYMDWISKRDNKICRLPTEAEWEFAARNGEQNSAFPWGDEWRENLANVATGKVSKVGSTSDETLVGNVEDMMGNVIEWTSSNYSLYSGHSGKLDSYNQKLYVIRGSSWGESQNRLKDATLLLTRRQSVPAEQKSPFLGFRVVCQP